MARFAYLTALFITLRLAASAAPLTSPGTIERASGVSIGLFVALVCVTLGIGVWASRRTRSAVDFYAAGGGITALKTAWLWLGLTYLRLLFSGFPAWSTSQVLAA
jgi:hypothetical protein